jgi:hypothetical protein
MNPSEPVRAWIYRALALVIAIAVVSGLISLDQIYEVAKVFAIVMGLIATALAIRNTSTSPADGDP